MSVRALRHEAAWSLTGTDVDLPDATEWSVPALVAELAERGWDRDAIAAVANSAHEEGRPWPFPHGAGGPRPRAEGGAGDRVRPLPPGIGAAQFLSAMREVRESLGLTGLGPARVSDRTRLDADERRLLQDAPPHHR